MNYFCLVFAIFIAENISTASENTRFTPETRVCGISTRNRGLIVKGSEGRFHPGDFPWIVALTLLWTTPPSFFCGGTLISTNHVITAAHCIKPKYGESGTVVEVLAHDILALFGAYNLTNDGEPGRLALKPVEHRVHDDWNPNVEHYDADIAALTFEKNVIQITKFIGPICLWTKQTEPVNTKGFVAGWGRSEDESKHYEPIPKKLKIPMHLAIDCFLKTPLLAELSSKRTFCAGLHNNNGVCLGDSGNGFFVSDDDDVMFLRGIVSASTTTATSCDVSKYAIYTDVLKFKSWINSILNDGRLTCRADATRWFENIGTRNVCVIENQSIEVEGTTIHALKDKSVYGLFIENSTEFKYIPINITDSFPNLKEIHIKNCSVVAVNDTHFQNLTELIGLELSWNNISTINVDAFKDLVNMAFLGIFNNRIEVLDENIFSTLRSLQRLWIQNNEIKELKAKIFDSLVKIELIDISNNKIRNLYENLFAKLSNLSELWCNSNQLVGLPSDLFRKNAMLKKLSLDSNKIKVLPETVFTNLTELTLLNLANNEIEMLGATTFKSLLNLEQLYLEGNQIQVLAPNIFASLHKIEVMSMPKNKIRRLYRNMLANLQHLREFSLAENLIVEIPDDFFRNNFKLEKLWLQGNKIKFIGSDLFGSLDRMQFVDLEDNVCVDKLYVPNTFEDFKKDVAEKCQRAVPKYVTAINFDD